MLMHFNERYYFFNILRRDFLEFPEIKRKKRGESVIYLLRERLLKKKKKKLPDRARASLWKQPRRSDILRVAMRRVDSLLLGTRCTPRLPSADVRRFPPRDVRCFRTWRGYWRPCVPPIHPAMTFKYFRTRRGVPSLLPRAGRPRETRGREMDEELPPLSVLPKLASHPATRKVGYFGCPIR